jgi:hypothetical protein
VRPVLEFVEARLAGAFRRVTLVTEPAGALLTLTERGVAHALKAPATWWYEPGEHRVRAEAPGHVAQDLAFTVGAEGSPAPGLIRLSRVPVAPAAVVVQVPARPGPEPVEGEEADAGSRPGGVRFLTWVALGSGGALLLGGLGTWLGAIQKAKDLNGRVFTSKAEFDRERDAQVRPLAITSYVLWGVGGAALVAGGVLLIQDLTADGGEASVGFRLAPVPLTGVAAVLAGFTF